MNKENLKTIFWTVAGAAGGFVAAHYGMGTEEFSVYLEHLEHPQAGMLGQANEIGTYVSFTLGGGAIAYCAKSIRDDLQSLDQKI